MFDCKQCGNETFVECDSCEMCGGWILGINLPETPIDLCIGCGKEVDISNICDECIESLPPKFWFDEPMNGGNG